MSWLANATGEQRVHSGVWDTTFGRSVGVGAVIALEATVTGRLPRNLRVLSLVVGLALAVRVGVLVFSFTSAQFSGDLQINRHVWAFAFFLGATPAWLPDRP